jgi:hypothetical protein
MISCAPRGARSAWWDASRLKKVIRGWAAIPLPLSSFLIELRGRQGRSRGAVEHLVSRRPKEHRLPSMANR